MPRTQLYSINTVKLIKEAMETHWIKVIMANI